MTGHRLEERHHQGTAANRQSRRQNRRVAAENQELLPGSQYLAPGGRSSAGAEAENNDTYVFPSPNGGPISPDSVNNMLKRVLERARIPKVRFHNLRHSFATIALQNGVDIKTVSGMLGHFSAGFTLDTYAHVTTSAQKEAAQTMGNLLSM